MWILWRAHWTYVMKQQGVVVCVSLWRIPSGKVYRCSIASKVDTHWACAVTYSSCSTHLLWLHGVPLSQFRGPCGSLCLSDLHWITLGKQSIKTRKWIHYTEWLKLQFFLPLDPLRLCPWLSSLSACPKSHRKVSLPSSDSNTLSAVEHKQSQSTALMLLSTCTVEFMDDIIRNRAAAQT